MTRYVALIALAWVLVGCRAPAPSFDFLAPYGSPRVPPPRTGAVGTGGTYYAPTTPNPQSPTAIPTTPTSPGGVLPPVGAAPLTEYDALPDALTDTTSDVAQASFESGSAENTDVPATTVTDETPSSNTTDNGSNAASTSSLQLNGMRVNDATTSSEPSQFKPPGESVNIANLPPATGNSPSFLRFLNPKAGTTSGTATAAPAAAATASGSGTWQSR